ncbi:MAG: energy-coupling factor transporter ATPase [Oscillospiraceae bacterium]
MESIINADKISFAYNDDDGKPHSVFEKLSIEIKQGELIAILGHNGSGKSTLAKHFNAILLPNGGTCYISGIDTANEDKLLEIRQTVGMVFQNPDNQIVATIVEEDVAFALENMGLPPAEIRKRVDEALEDVRMTKYKTHAPHRLSGGQKQRIAIAGVIAMRPKCIVLDEPTAMLDPRGRIEVMQTIKELREKFGITVVMITHFMDEAAQCDRVVVIDNGKIIFNSTPKDVFSHVDVLKKVGLDVPQSTELAYELIKCGINIPPDIITDNECIEEISKLLSK